MSDFSTGETQNFSKWKSWTLRRRWIKYISLLECFSQDCPKCSDYGHPEVKSWHNTPSPGIDFIIFAVFINYMFKAQGLMCLFLFYFNGNSSLMYRLSNWDSPSSTLFWKTVKSFLFLSAQQLGAQLSWGPRRAEPKTANLLTQTWKPRDLWAPIEAPSFSIMAAPKQTGKWQAVLQTIKGVSLKRGTFPQQAFFTSVGRSKLTLCSTLCFILFSFLTEDVLWWKGLDSSSCPCILTLKTTFVFISSLVTQKRSLVNSIVTSVVSLTITLQVIWQTWVLFIFPRDRVDRVGVRSKTYWWEGSEGRY